jgi:hypothetical protein
MTDASMSPDSLAKRFFIFMILGVVVYVTTIFVLIASPDEQRSDSADTPASALAQRR